MNSYDMFLMQMADMVLIKASWSSRRFITCQCPHIRNTTFCVYHLCTIEQSMWVICNNPTPQILPPPSAYHTLCSCVWCLVLTKSHIWNLKIQPRPTMWEEDGWSTPVFCLSEIFSVSLLRKLYWRILVTMCLIGYRILWHTLICKLKPQLT